jgi:hypothetical protein
MVRPRRINFVITPVCSGTINPTLHHPLQARFQPVGPTGRLPARRALVEHTARREGRLYEQEARTHYITIPLFSPSRRLYEPEANIPIVSEAN